eukprot:8090248-Karenia_brevis.AAC.1
MAKFSSQVAAFKDYSNPLHLAVSGGRSALELLAKPIHILRELAARLPTAAPGAQLWSLGH